MKKTTFLLLVPFIFFGQCFAENEMLKCPREEEIVEKIKADPNCLANQFTELSAKNTFEVELNYFDKEVVQKIMLDNVSNPNWLTQKGIQELRIHRLCLEKACYTMINECDTGKNFKEDNAQNAWCDKTVENVFEIEKIKVKTAILENQRRKTRSIFREKFRAIEVRSSQYLIPNIINFAREFKRFADKVTAFIFNPLQ